MVPSIDSLPTFTKIEYPCKPSTKPINRPDTVIINKDITPTRCIWYINRPNPPDEGKEKTICKSISAATPIPRIRSITSLPNQAIVFMDEPRYLNRLDD
ncbi:hypothetical protein J580_2285 [Acinetobacter sp. 1542444]|nr:hypothetical protein J580_2285 [Acinetobacter sp. 1542444]